MRTNRICKAGLAILITTFGILHTFAQTWHIGDIYTFPDSSKGVVCYVNPLNAEKGWVVDLKDLPGTYSMWTGTRPAGLSLSSHMAFNLSSWQFEGKHQTAVLLESGQSPAAEAVDFYSGWYIPDAVQLRKIYGLIPLIKGSIEAAGGDISPMSQPGRNYWSSSTSSIFDVSAYRMVNATDIYAGRIEPRNGTVSQEMYIRRVRDFGDEAIAFWTAPYDSIGLLSGSMLVSPEETRSYEAKIIYGKDTFLLNKTVKVHPSYHSDTLRETVCKSEQPYCSKSSPLFSNIDIRYATMGFDTISATTETVHGCDSVLTLLLKVVDDCNLLFYDTLCEFAFPYLYQNATAQFDTLFDEGTLSGVYEHHFIKDGLPAVSYLDLTVLPTTYGDTTAVACDSFTWHGVEYTSTPTVAPTHTYTSANGCDSVVTLHLTINKSKATFLNGEICLGETYTENGFTITPTAEGITTHTLNLQTSDGCDSTVTLTLTVTMLSSEISITCPPDHYDTLAFGDCVMNIYRYKLGYPAVHAPDDWLITITNDIPEDDRYYEGETVVTWTASEPVCGYSVSCQQKVIVVFPQCPDAIDCEGNVYHGVRVGCDCWTQTNLVSNCYGDANECATTGTCNDPTPCVYEYVSSLHPDVDANVAVYGKLYCDTAGIGDSTVNEHGHIQGICPEGWYLPTVEKYADLFLHGDALKSPLYWTDGGGSNSTGFSWLPAGWWNGALQRFEGLGSEGYFLAVETTADGVRTVVFSLQHDCDEVKRLNRHSGFGYSVRCVKERERKNNETPR